MAKRLAGWEMNEDGVTHRYEEGAAKAVCGAARPAVTDERPASPAYYPADEDGYPTGRLPGDICTPCSPGPQPSEPEPVVEVELVGDGFTDNAPIVLDGDEG